jgi:hypothetical protein
MMWRHPWGYLSPVNGKQVHPCLKYASEARNHPAYWLLISLLWLLLIYSSSSNKSLFEEVHNAAAHHLAPYVWSNTRHVFAISIRIDWMPQDIPPHRHKQNTDYRSVCYIILLSKKWRAREVILRFTTAPNYFWHLYIILVVKLMIFQINDLPSMW